MDEINHKKLTDINAKGKLYKAKDRGKMPFLELLQSHCPVSAELKLKVGCQVILPSKIPVIICCNSGPFG